MKPPKKKPEKQSSKNRLAGKDEDKRKASQANNSSKSRVSEKKRTGNAVTKIKTENLLLRKQLEHKNRELEIEAAVARVRAKAMAMHKSKEVLGVVVALKDELTRLNLSNPITATTIFLNQDDGTIRMWDITRPEKMTDNLNKNFDLIFLPEETPADLYIMRIWKSKGNYVVVEQHKKDFNIMIRWLSKFDKKAAKDINGVLRKHKITHGWHPAVRLKQGWLCVDLITPPPAELKLILTHMGAAFDLAYQRFLDLQKAEALAREAQIETALEKVRSRSMAMQKSEELKEVIQIVYDQLTQLKMPVEHTGFILDYKNSNDFNSWIADHLGSPSYITIPYFDALYYNRFNEAKKKGLDFFCSQPGLEGEK